MEKELLQKYPFLKDFKGVIYEDSGETTCCYDHLFNTDFPNKRQYEKMLNAAKKDAEILKKNNVKFTLCDGKARYDMGLPYIDIEFK